VPSQIVNDNDAELTRWPAWRHILHMAAINTYRKHPACGRQFKPTK
jgi:hypothetical protein